MYVAEPELARSAHFFLKSMGILSADEIPLLVVCAPLKMCRRCLSFTRNKSRLGEIETRGKEAGCRCQKQCERLIEGVCADCGHYVRHP